MRFVGLMSLLLLWSSSLLAQSNITPCANFPTVIDDYIPQQPNYHHYEVRQQLVDLSVYKTCTPGFVYNIMKSRLSFNVPGGAADLPVPLCSAVEVFIYVPLLPFKPKLGNIVTKYDDRQLTVTNYTLPGHFLHAGKVERKVTRIGNKIYVITTGIGNNQDKWRKLANEFKLSPEIVWGSVNVPLYADVNARLKHIEDAKKSDPENLDFLRDLKGSVIYETEFFNYPYIRLHLIKLIGSRNYDLLRSKLSSGPGYPIKIVDNKFVLDGCQAHWCDQSNFRIVIDLTIRQMFVGIRENGNVRAYSEGGRKSNLITAWENNKL